MTIRSLMALFALCASSCATVPGGELPLLLSGGETEGGRYEPIGVVTVARTRFGDAPFSSGDREWAEEALRREASALGADAVTSPEITVVGERFLFFPVVEIRARAKALRLQ